MAARKLRIILHGKVAGHEEFREAVHRLRAQGHTVEVSVTWEAGDALRLAREAVKDGVETVVAAGGDGTINQVASGLLRCREESLPLPSFGICPLGTANDFAVAAGIPLIPEAALENIVSLDPVAIDAGKMGDHYFINVATGGFGAEITAETSEELKGLLGGAAYLATGLTRFGSVEPLPARLSGPNFSWEGPLLVLAVGNGRQSGGGVALCPTARLNDGLLDVAIVPELPLSEMAEILGSFLAMGKSALGEVGVHTQLPWIEIECAEPLALNLDGEPTSGARFRFEVVPQALRLHLPPSDILVAPAEGNL